MAKVSLCIICGNVEQYIERCLESFAPAADEIVLVRAIGAAPPDKTIELATAKYPQIKVGEYKNKDGREHWEHLDDFAAARQLSFDLATGDYCLWADTDDVLEKGCHVIRELAESAKWDCHLFPYRIFGKGMMVPRDRLIRRGCGRWAHAVHEFFDYHIKPAQGAEDRRVVITHLPGPAKTGSNERNLKILLSIPEDELTTGLLYHLHLELALSGDIPGSIDAAKRFLNRTDVGKAEKYEVFLNLAQASEDPNCKEALLHQAYSSDPGRREALMLLANHAMNCGAFEKGLSYARQMMATPPPMAPEWNDRPSVYGWVGEDIFSQALRANGLADEAEVVRKRSLKINGGARITLLQPARGDVAAASRIRKQWLDSADKPERIEHAFLLWDNDDETDPLRRMHHILVPGDMNFTGAFNVGIKKAAGDVVVKLEAGAGTPRDRWDEALIAGNKHNLKLVEAKALTA